MGRIRRSEGRAVLYVLVVSSSLAMAHDQKPIQSVLPKREQAIDFQTDVLPILRSNCIACHNAKTNENDLILETVEQIVKGGSSGVGVVPGKPDESLVYLVAARSEEPVMPPLPNDANARTLTPAELGLLRQWIIEGAMVGAEKRAAVAWRPVNRRLRAVYCVDYDANTGTVAASSADRVTLYDLHSRASLGWLADPDIGERTHRDIVQSLAFHPSQALLVTGGYRTVKLWKPVKAATTVREFDKPAQRLAVSKDGRFAVSFGSNVRVYSSDGTKQRVVEAEGDVTAICFGSGQKLAVASKAGVLQVFDDLSKQLSRFEFKSITSMTFGAAETQLIAGHADGSVLQWNLDARKSRTLKPAGDVVTAIDRSPDGKLIAAIAESGKVSVIDAASGKTLQTLKSALQHNRKREKRYVLDEQVAGRRINYRTEKVKAAKAEVDSQQRSLKTANENVPSARKALDEAGKKKAAEDKKVATTREAVSAKPGDKTLKAKLDAVEKNQQKLLDGLNKAKRSLAAAKQEVEILNSSLARAKRTLKDQSAKQQLAMKWRDKLAADREQWRLAKATAASAGTSVRFVNQSVVETVHADGTIRTWDAQGGSLLTEVRSGSDLASGAGRYALSSDGRKLLKLNRAPTWRSSGPLETGEISIVGRVRSMAFDPSGSLLAIGSGKPSRSGQIQIWDVKSRKLVREIPNAHSDTVLDVEFSPDGQLLLSCSADKLAKIWKVSDGRFVQSFEGHTHYVTGASWQADMTRVVTAGADKVVKVWDAETGSQQRTIRAHSKQITGLQCVGPAESLVSCSGDRTVRAFTAGNGRTVRTFSGSNDYVHSLAVAWDESVVVAGSDDGTVRLWNGKDGKPIATFNPVNEQ